MQIERVYRDENDLSPTADLATFRLITVTRFLDILYINVFGMKLMN